VQALPAVLGGDQRANRLAGGQLNRPNPREEARQVVQESDGGSPQGALIPPLDLAAGGTLEVPEMRRRAIRRRQAGSLSRATSRTAALSVVASIVVAGIGAGSALRRGSARF
jgi:hypothetical protein